MTTQRKFVSSPTSGSVGYIIRWSGHFENGEYLAVRSMADESEAREFAAELAFGYSVLASIEAIFFNRDWIPSHTTWLSKVRYLESEAEEAGKYELYPYPFRSEDIEPLTPQQVRRLGLHWMSTSQPQPLDKAGQPSKRGTKKLKRG